MSQYAISEYVSILCFLTSYQSIRYFSKYLSILICLSARISLYAYLLHYLRESKQCFSSLHMHVEQHFLGECQRGAAGEKLRGGLLPPSLKGRIIGLPSRPPRAQMATVHMYVTWLSKETNANMFELFSHPPLAGAIIRY